MTARQRRRHRRSQGSSVGKKVLLVFVGLFAVIAVALGGGVIWVLNVAADAPDIDTLKPADSGSNTQIFAADGSSLGYVQSDILRTPVALDEIPERLQKATIAIEDEHFYDHGGVDYSAIIRAAVENFEAGEVKQGASTITQQLVRNLYIRDPRDTIERKIKEAKMAMQYEDEYTKSQILNAVPEHRLIRDQQRQDRGRGRGRLAGLLRQGRRRPQHRRGGAARRPPAGAHRLQPVHQPEGRQAAPQRGACGDGATRATSPRRPTTRSLPGGSGCTAASTTRQRSQQYFFDFVQQELIDKYGVATARDGGLKVYTTLDPALQAVAEQAIAAHPVYRCRRGARLDRRRHRRDHRDGLLVRPTRTASSTSPPRAARQPGSSFKPYALTAAVAQGIDPDSTYYPAPSDDQHPAGNRRRAVDRRAAASAARSACARRPPTPSTRSTPSSSPTSALRRWTTWRRRWA